MKNQEFERTILSQYANSTKLVQLLRNFNDAVDPDKDIRKFIKEELDLDSCGTHGLDVWGIVVGAPRLINIDDDDWFGFYGSEYQPFDEAPFYPGRSVTTVYRLDNEAYRKLIYYKAGCNIGNETIPDIDLMLATLFSEKTNGDIYAQDIGSPMHMRVMIGFEVTPVEIAIFKCYGGLLRPTGVWMEWHFIPVDTFGFAEAEEYQPFGHGVFWLGAYVSAS